MSTSQQDEVVINQQKGKEVSKVATEGETFETNVLSEESIKKTIPRPLDTHSQQAPAVTRRVLDKLFNIMVDFEIPEILPFRKLVDMLFYLHHQTLVPHLFSTDHNHRLHPQLQRFFNLRVSICGLRPLIHSCGLVAGSC